MHWTDSSKNVSEEGGADGSVSCPVCSVYLRKDVTLQDHLNTHPKQDVIEALIHLKDSLKEPSNSKRSNTISPQPAASAIGSESHHSAASTVSDIKDIKDVKETVETQHQVQIPRTVSPSAREVQISSGSSFISFPQLLGSSTVPQFILPLVTGANASSNQSPIMPLLFNPFMFTAGTPSISEYLTSNNLLRGPFQIIQASSSRQIPVSGIQQVPQLLPLYPRSEGESNRLMHDASNANPAEQVEESDVVEAISNCSSPYNEANEAEAEANVEVITSSPFGESPDWNSIGSPENHSTCSAEGSLRVRTDLRVSSVASPSPPSEFEGDEISEPDFDKEDVKLHIGLPSTSCAELVTSSSVISNSPVIVHLNRRKSHALPLEDEGSPPISECNNITQTPNSVEVPEAEQQNLNINSSTSNCSTIVGLDSEGLHFLVPFGNSLPSGTKNDQTSGTSSPGRPNSPPCDSSPTSPYQKSVDSPTVPLNIQTDETMPPRGELSEQESIGGNSSSMWSVPPYQMNRELLSPVVSTSFDLTARESWAGSDISDCEGNANQAPDTSLYRFSTTPSFSNAIPHLLPKPSEANFLDQKPVFTPNQLPQGRGKGKGSNKPPPKPRVYKCKACALEFPCPKERRVHPCEKKKEPKSKGSSAERTNTVMHSVSDGEVVVPGSSTTEDKACAPIKPKRKYSRKPKATNVKKEVVEVRPTEQSPFTEVRPAGQPQFNEVWPAGQSQLSDGRPAVQFHFGEPRPVGQLQFGDIKPVAQSQYNIEQVDKMDLLDVAHSKLHEGESIALSEIGPEGCPPPRNMTFVEVTPALLDQKVDLKQEYFKKVNSCTECNLIFSNAKDLSRHLTLKHKVNRYQCTTCGESFDKESAYYEHLNIHPLECRLCGKCFHRGIQSRDSSKAICKSRSGKKSFCCLKPYSKHSCNTRLFVNSRKSLSLHMKWHMEVKPYKCDSCEKSFVTRQKLDEHQNTHTGNAPIKCPHCDETFKRYSNLIQHKNRHHLDGKRKVKDHICHCGEVFQSRKRLEWHKEIHDNKPKSCLYCSERFVHTSSLTRHVRKAHDKRYVPKAGREGENVECPVCNSVFLKSSLATHIKVHSGERPFSCHICGKDFTTKWNLQHHKWTHASRSSKPFKCTLCKAAFYRKQDYSGHMRSHRNVRPFTCNHCGCQFIRKYNCLRHMKEHDADKRYTCTICNKTFHRGYYLKDHMRVHDGSRPFSCHICGKASTTKSNHNKHVRIHHAREPQNTEI